MNYLKLDLGCGFCKKEGNIGIDILEQLGIDCVVNYKLKHCHFPTKTFFLRSKN